MNLQDVFCPYEGCCAKGVKGQGNIVWWQRRRKRCKCQRCGRTFSYRRGTLFDGLRTEEGVVRQVVTLLVYGCPCQAIVAAFGIDKRTVRDWQHRAGQHAQAVQEAQVIPLDLQQVRRMLWVGMAIMVSTRLWLGAVVSSQRDQTFIRRLAGLVRHSLRGKDHDMPYLRCQRCHTVFSSRKGTPLYSLKTKPDQVELVLWFLAEGVNRAVLVRYTGHQGATLARWLERMGEHSQGLHNRLFRGLVLRLVQLDEWYTQVKDREQARWLWLVIDPVTKIIPTLHLRGRKGEDAYAVAHDLKERVAPDGVPTYITDGLWLYFYALTAHFGHWFRPLRARTDHWQPDDNFRLAQLVKQTQRRRLTYTIRRMAWGQRRALFEVLTAQGFRQTIQTAFIEQLNLTFRQGVAGLARQTWALASEQHLLLHTEWFRLYYHLARPHEALREPIPGDKGISRARTPAMATGLTVGDILRMPLIPAAAKWRSPERQSATARC